jgi:outer membrane lipoprotein-sorting protein
MTNTTNIIRTTTRVATLFTMSFIACTVAFGTIEAADPGHAFAAPKSKKAQEATKRMGQSFDYLVKAGQKAQSKRGVGMHQPGSRMNWMYEERGSDRFQGRIDG